MKLHFLAQLEMEETERQRRAKHHCAPSMLAEDPWPVIETAYYLSDLQNIMRKRLH
jgi:hypothetical protein